MEKFAVAFYNGFDNQLKLTFVEAADWKHALIVAGHSTDEGLLSFDGMTYEQAQNEASFNQDWSFAIEEVNL